MPEVTQHDAPQYGIVHDGLNCGAASRVSDASHGYQPSIRSFPSDYIEVKKRCAVRIIDRMQRFCSGERIDLRHDFGWQIQTDEYSLVPNLANSPMNVGVWE